MRIKKLILTDFKGVKSIKEYDLDGDMVSVKGRNAAGKSTLAIAHFWLWCGMDYALASNPNILPNDGRECTPTVEEVIDIDGVEHTVSKSQKMRKSKDGKVTLTNNYSINGVEKSQTSFKAWTAEKGIDLDKFALLSNPNAFMSEKSKDMRELLFSMASEKTDLEIAESMENVVETVALLKNYKLDEIEAMQKQSIRKINDVHGKSGELTAAKIEGLESAKVEDVDIAERELQKSDLERQIAEINTKITDAGKAVDDLRGKEMQLQFDMSAIMQTMNTDILNKRNKKNEELSNIDWKIQNIEYDLKLQNAEYSRNLHELENFDGKKESINQQYKENNAKVFDDSGYFVSDADRICPTCGREFDKDKIVEIIAENEKRIAKAREEFLTDKENKKKKILEIADEVKTKVKELEEANERLIAEQKEKAKERDELLEQKKKLQEQISRIPTQADYAQNADYNRLKAEDDKVLAEIERLQNSGSDDVTDALNVERQQLSEQLDNVKAIIAKASRNVEIDEQIADLQRKGREYEQQRADAEKILYQISLIGKRKNEMLSDEINSHFQYVKFKLFDYLKNGEYKDTCIPTIQDENGAWKEWGAMNGGLRVKAQIDICQSLQKYRNTLLPIFIDEAAEINYWNIPKTESQLILLKVTTDNDLTIEKEN